MIKALRESNFKDPLFDVRLKDVKDPHVVQRWALIELHKEGKMKMLFPRHSALFYRKYVLSMSKM